MSRLDRQQPRHFVFSSADCLERAGIPKSRPPSLKQTETWAVFKTSSGSRSIGPGRAGRQAGGTRVGTKISALLWVFLGADRGPVSVFVLPGWPSLGDQSVGLISRQQLRFAQTLGGSKSWVLAREGERKPAGFCQMFPDRIY